MNSPKNNLICEVLIPFYNEAHRFEQSVAELAHRIREHSILSHDIQIRFWWGDDGSTDQSSAVLRKCIDKSFLGLTQTEHQIIRKDRNQGKGSMILHLVQILKSQNYENHIVSFWDSDGELDAKGLLDSLLLFKDSNTAPDVIFGSRFSKRNAQVLNYRHYLGNKTLTVLSNWFSNLNLSDVHCCFRAMKGSLLFKLPLQSKGFEFEAEFVGILGRVRKAGLRLIEVPLVYIPRTVEQGKKVNLRHVWPQIFTAIRCRYFVKEIHLN